MALATDLLTYAFTGDYDVGIVASRDTDLLPAMERVVELGLAEVEVAGWRGLTRLNFRDRSGPWGHALNDDDYDLVRDPTD